MRGGEETEETEVNSRDVETYYLRGWVKGTSKKVMLIIMNDITSYKINIYICNGHQ